MNPLIKKLTEAQHHAISIRPSVGGFPYVAEALRQAGVEHNVWTLPACQSIYVMNEGVVVQQGTPLVTGTYEVPVFDQEALIRAIRKDQAGESTFPEFLLSTWNAGVVSYDVDCVARTVSYYGPRGEKYVEQYPKVEVQK